MAQQQQVVIEITEQAEVKLTVNGVAGQSCKALTEDIEKAIGTTTTDEKTKEYYARPERTHVVNKR